MTLENAETLAQRLISCSYELGAINTELREQLGGSDSLMSCPDALDIVTGPESGDVAASLRELAMALDRAALIKHDS